MVISHMVFPKIDLRLPLLPWAHRYCTMVDRSLRGFQAPIRNNYSYLLHCILHNCITLNPLG
jgi:hypothetical protein